MDYSIENLEKAVTIFYKNGQQGDAHQWLTQAQNSSQAWSFVWELLDPRRSSEVQFFAATTLHTKLLKYWFEVPEDHYELLRKRILDSVVTYAMGPKLVLNRLCIALSAYVIHTIPKHWPNAFEALVSSFQPRNLPEVEPERVIWILLEILSVIPEEFHSMSLGITKKAKVNSILQAVVKDILKVVEMCITPIPGIGFNIDNLTTYFNATKCCSAWIQLKGVTIEDCSHILYLLVDLTCYVYWNKSDCDTMLLDEVDLAEAALESLSSVMLQPETCKYERHIFNHTKNILEKFGKILTNEAQISNINKDIVTSIYSLLITIGDNHCKFFINNLKPGATNTEEHAVSIMLIESILACSDIDAMYPVDETCSSLAFGYWYTLQDDVSTLASDKTPDIVEVIKPYYRNLVCIMLRKSMYPYNWDEYSNSNSNWSREDCETFRCYRQDISDTFTYCYNILNIETLTILHTKLNEALEKHTWNEIESCLHGFAAVSECLEWDEVQIPQLMLTLKNIPYGTLHIKVLATALDTIGSYAEWLPDSPTTIPNIIPLIVSGLENTELAPNATMALKDVTHNCQKYLEPFTDYLLAACQSALQGEQLRLSERIRLMYSLGYILSVLPINRIMEYLNVIIGSSVEEIQSLVNSTANNSVNTSIVTRLKLLSSLFSTLHVKHVDSALPVNQPILLVMENMLPLLSQIAVKYYNNPEVMEVLCGLLKHTVTTLLDDCKPLVPNILHLLMGTYMQIPNSSTLNLARSLLIMFSNDEVLSPMLKQFLKEIVNSTLQLCVQLNDRNELSNQSDVLEGLFSLLTQLCKKNSSIVFESGIDCDSLFHCGILCLALPEVQTIKACVHFLTNFISLSRERDQAHIVQKYGDSLVHRILLNMGGASPRSTAELLTDILLALNKKYCDNLARWLNTQLAQEGFPTALVSTQQKEHFIRLVLREKANKRRLTETITEFTLICRGIVKQDI